MRKHVLRFNSLKAIAKRVVLLLAGVVLLLNFTQTAVMAAHSPDAQTQQGTPGITETIRDQDNSAAKEERREWQSKASAVRDDEENKPTTLGEKLNIDELAKGYHPEREAAKRSVPTP
jgi:CxxC motif-containing protein (DUF1111 family)